MALVEGRRSVEIVAEKAESALAGGGDTIDDHVEVLSAGGADFVAEGAGGAGEAGQASVVLEGVVVAGEAGALLGAGAEGSGGAAGVASGD